MSDKLSRIKLIAASSLVLLLTLASSCGFGKKSTVGSKSRGGEPLFKREQIIKAHTIISCPGRPQVILRYTNATAVEEAARKAYEKKKKEETNETYTALRFPLNRSVMIKNVAPEDILKCEFFEIPVNAKESKKAHFFFR